MKAPEAEAGSGGNQKSTVFRFLTFWVTFSDITGVGVMIRRWHIS